MEKDPVGLQAEPDSGLAVDPIGPGSRPRFPPCSDTAIRLLVDFSNNLINNESFIYWLLAEFISFATILQTLRSSDVGRHRVQIVHSKVNSGV